MKWMGADNRGHSWLGLLTVLRSYFVIRIYVEKCCTPSLLVVYLITICERAPSREVPASFVACRVVPLASQR